MITSQLTVKGQTTIPAPVRKALDIKAHDRLSYEILDDTVVIRPLRGTILDFAGSVTPKNRPEDFREIRQAVKRGVANRSATRG